MHWLQVNRNVGFWVHRGDDVKVCAAKNPMMLGKPVVAHRNQFYRDVYQLWMEKVQSLARPHSRKRP
jgi:hypothetical protein